MKTLFLSLIFSFLFLGDKTGLLLEKNKIQLSIDRNTTQDQLTSYKEALSKKNIKFWIEKVDYNEDKKIKYIKIQVDCNDGFKGSSGETFLGERKNKEVGFYRIYNTKGSPFGMSPSPEE